MMFSKRFKFLLAANGMLLGSAAFAHHSQAMFDMSKCYELEGTVRTFEFQFPHSWLWVVVPNASGTTDVWGFESASPSQMVEVDPRWKRDMFKKGDKIKVRFSPMRDGRTGGAMASVTMPDGASIRAATPACSSGTITTAEPYPSVLTKTP